MPRKRVKRDFGEGDCQYRNCDRPGKKFPKKKENQKFCSDVHRIAEWNLQHPRTKEGRDALAQVPMPFPTPAIAGAVVGGVQGPMPITGREWPNMKFTPRSEKEKRFEGGDGMKEKGQKQAVAHSNGFVVQMRNIAVRIAKEKGNVSSDDLRAEAVKLGIAPHHPNVWGSIFDSNFEMIDRKKSEYKGNHAREIKVWALVKKETGEA